MAVNFDPNFTMCGRVAEYQVKLTFGLWEQRAEMLITCTNNVTGVRAIRWAVEQAYQSLPDEHGRAVINIGDIECVDEDNEGEDWLSNMLVAAEIVSIKPTSKNVFGLKTPEVAPGDAAA